MSTLRSGDDAIPENLETDMAEIPEQGNAISPDADLSASMKNVSAQTASGMLQPFRERNFNLLFGGQTISTIGDALYAVALPWVILNDGGNARELGIVLAVYGIPRVGGILAGGWLSDRLRPRRLMLLADSVRALLVGILTVLVLQGHPALWQLCALALPLGTFAGAFMPASMAILPDILSEETLQAGNALNFSSTQAANLVGSAIAGIIVATLSAGAALAADALSFIVSASSLAMMHASATSTRNDVPIQTEAANAFSEKSEEQTAISLGRFLFTSRLIQVTFVVSIAANFCIGGLIEVALPALVHGPMHGGANGYGLILAAFSAGALGGGVLAGTLGRLKRQGLVALLAALGMAVTLALIPEGGVLGAAGWMLIGGIANSITNVLMLTIIQLAIPRHLMGRVMGLILFASFGTYPLSVALAGVLSDRLGPALLFPFSGLLLGLPILFGITQRELRDR